MVISSRETASRWRLPRVVEQAGPYLGWGMALVLFALYAVSSVRGHQLLHTYGYDLGIFEQVVRSYAEGRPGITELKGPGFRQLGDHFTPALVLLAPFYRVFPSPLTLLVAQSALMAVSVVPLYGWARRALGTGPALVIGLGYGLSFGIAQAVRFDFHEVAFAVPLLAMSMTALGERRLGAAAGWALPLLLVKEDLGLTVAAIGLLIAYRGGRRLGLTVAAIGVAGMVLVVAVLLPAMSPDGAYAYTSMVAGGGGGHHLRELPVKTGTLFITFAVTGFAALRSPLALVTVPTLAWRFAGEKEEYWGIEYHYSAVLMPIVFAALIAALSRAREDDAAGPRRIGRAELAAVAVVAALLFPRTPLFETFQARTWRAEDRIAVAYDILGEIPDGATVAATNNLVPQLTSRTTTTLFGFPGLRPDPEWIVVDRYLPQEYPLDDEEREVHIAAAKASGYRVVREEAGFLLLRRP